ncbi:terpene synthase family protein [Streptomyces corynorhini]|uniref:Terpene synthase n=1 Tax=Streptomyces corynorhini TaxID=2282652 RepID=A0A370ARP7_9ACTN|nr:hypothetical protein [Streptomyces corynorhini]RDG30146.1 hypothetical protein DVH02_34465 [Streptomyces corynorhini]
MSCVSEQRLVQQLPAVPFYCPVPPARHRAVEVLNDQTVRWMLQQRLDTDEQQLKRLAVCDFGGLTASTMPYGQLEPLTLMSKFHAVLFSLDDGVCDESEATADLLVQETSRIMRAVESPDAGSPHDSPHTAALRRLRLELERYASPRQLRRMTDAMRVYTSGLVWEASWRGRTELPSLDDYVTLWMRAIGMAPSTAMIEIVGGFSVADEDLQDPRVRALTEITWTLVSWDNDLYSRNKELERADDNLNLIDVVCQEQDCSPQRALIRVVTMRDRVMVLFDRLSAQVLDGANEELRRYVNGLGQFVRGHLDWASSCPRYAVPTGPKATPGGWWKRQPADDSLEPLAIPTIAWWWDQLEPAR